MTYTPKTKSYVSGTRTINILAKDGAAFGELKVEWAGFECISPLGLEFERKEGDKVVNQVSFNLPRDSAKALAKFILENL